MLHKRPMSSYCVGCRIDGRSRSDSISRFIGWVISSFVWSFSDLNSLRLFFGKGFLVWWGFFGSNRIHINTEAAARKITTNGWLYQLELILMSAFFEDLSELSHLILLFCSFLFYRTLKKAKRERKLTVFEIILMLLIPFGVFSWAVSFVMLKTS